MPNERNIMIRRKSTILVSTIAILVNSFVFGNSIDFPKIDRKPEPASWNKGKANSLAKYDPNSSNPFQIDLRSIDLSSVDLRKSLDDLQYANFDDRTVWPDPKIMPKDYNWKHIMELGKNPGLGIRQLHKNGITGRGIGIAILDQPLLVGHQEYSERLRLYEEINIQSKTESQMHGPAVASIAVGKTVGVAPEADLYYIAKWNDDRKDGNFTQNFTYLAQGVQRILEINEQLPKDKKIRVISISMGWSPSRKGYKEISEAVEKAKEAGMLVISSSVSQVHGFKFHALGRTPLADPDMFDSYEPGLFWAKQFHAGIKKIGSRHLLIPMDSRTTASPHGPDEYVFYRVGGWSWSIPYIAGVYALAAQVEPAITPERFWMLAMKTGRTIELEKNGKKIPFGPILNPAKLIDAIRSGELSDSKALATEFIKYSKDDDLSLTELKFLQNINTNVDRIDINKATVDDIIEVFGKPLAYQLGRQFFKRHKLPDKYIINYPAGFSIFMVDDHIEELRFVRPGYKFRNKLQVGATLEDTFASLGQPLKIVQGRPGEFKDGILYKDIDGRIGYCYYYNKGQNVRLFFEEYMLKSLFLTVSN